MKIRRDVLNQIVEHLTSELPREGWGLLAGNGDEVERVYRMRNISDGLTAYENDTEELYRVLTGINDIGMDLQCIYHSHPPVGAYFSQVDLDRAWIESWQAPAYPGVAYLVFGFRGESAPQEWKAFRVEEGRAIEETVEIVDQEVEE